ncbi:hypothetical protein [Nocardioides guangzhouensis]|uniref:hypothetical protein n=1 Tax=Nocardioides guangzhouensis TaxID=2497878 RepID=UPI001FEA28F4|nr:hypothetical protein [Nocardioides guangzhouensis]
MVPGAGSWDGVAGAVVVDGADGAGGAALVGAGLVFVGLVAGADGDRVPDGVPDGAAVCPVPQPASRQAASRSPGSDLRMAPGTTSTPAAGYRPASGCAGRFG